MATPPKPSSRSGSCGWSGFAPPEAGSRCTRKSGTRRRRAKRRRGGDGPSRRRDPRPIPCGRREGASVLRHMTARQLAAGEGAPRRRDRLALVARPLDDTGVEPEAAHHALGAGLEPQALAVAVVRDVVVAEARVALPRPLLQPGDVVADELAAVLVVADEAVKAVDVLVQPDRVEVVAAEIPERLDGRARIAASSGVAGYSRR